jgi:uncharacterized protein YutE (UPF0331/DUF86 family)
VQIFQRLPLHVQSRVLREGRVLYARDQDALYEEATCSTSSSRHGSCPPETVGTLRRMKGCRNILVHEYGHVLDELIFETITTRLGDFDDFRRAVLQALAQS